MDKDKVPAKLPLDIVSYNQIKLKIDFRILPILSLCYLLAMLDRTNISNARIANSSSAEDLDSILKLTDMQAQLSISAFFIGMCLNFFIDLKGYILFEIPSNIMMIKFSPSFWIARIMLTWGIVATGLAFVTNFTGLMVCRVLLGIFEAGYAPGVILYLTYWYPRRERAFRIGIFYCASSVSGSLGGLIAYGVTKDLNGVFGLEGFRWIFLLGKCNYTGSIYRLLFSSRLPKRKCKFLSNPEKEILTAILREGHATSSTDHSFDYNQCKAVITSPFTYIYCIQNFCLGTPLYSLSFAVPSILLRLGYQDLTAQLMSVLPHFLAFLSILIFGYLSDKYNNRVVPMLIGGVGMVIGFSGMIAATVPIHKYVFVCIANVSVNCVKPSILAIINEDSVGSTNIAIMTAMVIASANFGGVLNPFLYPKIDAPNYYKGNFTNLALGAIFVILLGVTRVLKRNKQRNQLNV